VFVILPQAQRVRLSELELLDRKVTRDGGALRYLEGARYGLRTAIYRSEIVPGSGPEPHTHPYAEIFVIEQGEGRYQVGSTFIDAEGGDIVIVPPDSPHAFVNTGAGILRHVAIHDGSDHAISEPAVLGE
jgi:quercetin dioxygenase-like cupin family protein